LFGSIPDKMISCICEFRATRKISLGALTTPCRMASELVLEETGTLYLQMESFISNFINP